MKFVYVRKVKGSGLTKTQKALLGSSAALLGVAGAAALASRNVGPQPTNLDRAMQDLAAQRLNATISQEKTQPRLSPAQAKKQVMQDQIARSAYLAQQYGMPPARSYDEIIRASASRDAGLRKQSGVLWTPNDARPLPQAKSTPLQRELRKRPVR